jgi:hypothetical protein
MSVAQLTPYAGFNRASVQTRVGYRTLGNLTRCTMPSVL